MTANFKTKLTRNQLSVVFDLVKEMIDSSPSTMWDKLLISNMISIHKKLLLKWTYITYANNKVIAVSLTPSEAISFYLVFNSVKDESGCNPFTVATLTPILNNIYKKFI